jgi:hypothetical protein
VKKARAKPGKIFVGGLKSEMSDDDIKDAFSAYGAVIEMELPFDKMKNARKGFGFITFEREETMKDLIKMGKVGKMDNLGAGYTSDLVRKIYCKSQMRFSVSAIWCTTRITSYLFFAPNCRCDLVYLRFGVRFRVRTANRNTISQHHIACYV